MKCVAKLPSSITTFSGHFINASYVEKVMLTSQNRTWDKNKNLRGLQFENLLTTKFIGTNLQITHKNKFINCTEIKQDVEVASRSLG